MLTGYILALITSLLFSIYLLPRKFASQSPAVYAIFFSAGFLSASLLYWIVSDFASLMDPALIISCATGVIYTVGLITFTKSIDSIGLTQSNQWKNLQGPTGAALGLWLLTEASQANALFVISAAAFIFISAVLLTVKDETPKKLKLTGVLLALTAAISFGVCAYLQKMVMNIGVPVSAQLVCTSTFMLITSVIYCVLALKNQNYNITNRNNILGAFAGSMYFAAALCMLLSFELLPVSIAFPIVQLNAVWTISIGIIVFKEVSFKKHWQRISLGLVFAVLGVVCLAAA